MADPTKAEIMLDQVTKINALIRRFQLCKDHPIPPLRLDLALVEQIPDGEVQTVLKLRYGLLDNSTKKMPWMDIPLLMNYELETLYRRHRKGIDCLNMLLESEVT